MEHIHQTDCFDNNRMFWKFLGIWSIGRKPYYRYYSITFITTFVVFYNILASINFFFLPRQLDSYIEELLFYFTQLAVLSKVMTFLFMKDEISSIFQTLESDQFQPTSAKEAARVNKAKKFVKRYWQIVAIVSITSNLTHVITPVITHIVLSTKLHLQVCSYAFLSEEFKEMFIYPLYFYQIFGMHFLMLYNLNIDTFILGLLILTIAHLKIMNKKLKYITKTHPYREAVPRLRHFDETINEDDLILKLNQSVIYFDEIAKLCFKIQKVFSASLFVQFSMASCIICICLFRFTLPAPLPYYVFLVTYMFIMVIQILVPCWFGTRLMDKSFLLSRAAYDCNWIPRSSRFKSSIRFFVQRTQNRPLTIICWQMFPLSLRTFTSIINYAYSFLTLLRHFR